MPTVDEPLSRPLRRGRLDSWVVDAMHNHLRCLRGVCSATFSIALLVARERGTQRPVARLDERSISDRRLSPASVEPQEGRRCRLGLVKAGHGHDQCRREPEGCRFPRGGTCLFDLCQWETLVWSESSRVACVTQAVDSGFAFLGWRICRHFCLQLEQLDEPGKQTTVHWQQQARPKTTRDEDYPPSRVARYTGFRHRWTEGGEKS
jgi:hypothetical protein